MIENQVVGPFIMSKSWQEFYCTRSGGGCGKYFIIGLNLNINHIVDIVCPGCGHKHRRHIEDGVIKEQGRHKGKVIEEIIAPKSSLSDKPLTTRFQKKEGNERDGSTQAVGDNSTQVAGCWFVFHVIWTICVIYILYLVL